MGHDQTCYVSNLFQDLTTEGSYTVQNHLIYSTRNHQKSDSTSMDVGALKQVAF